MKAKTDSMTTFLSAYLECALWASHDDDGDSFDDVSIYELPEETILQARIDCDAFEADNADDLAQWREAFGSDEQAGHDFWLTRNGHGAGFWDRFSSGHPLHEAGERLTAASKVWGSCDLYRGDDGQIYMC